MKYQLTVARTLATALVLIAGAPVNAQWLKDPTPGIPRTPDGKPNLSAPAPKLDRTPDLSGIWRADPGGYVDPGGRHVPFKVEFHDDQLIARPPGGGGFPLVPESDTVFSASGARVEFFTDARGTVTHFVVRTVEGDQTGTRKR